MGNKRGAMHISKAPKRRVPIDPTASNDLTRVRSLKELRWLSPERLAKLVASLKTFDIKRGEVIFDEHQAAKYVYLLLSGTASITCLDTRQKRLLLALAPIGVIPKRPLLQGRNWDRRSLRGFQQLPSRKNRRGPVR